MPRALPPEAWERDALAIEIRVHWGATLLAVQHLEPPRSFSIASPAAARHLTTAHLARTRSASSRVPA